MPTFSTTGGLNRLDRLAGENGQIRRMADERRSRGRFLFPEQSAGAQIEPEGGGVVLRGDDNPSAFGLDLGSGTLLWKQESPPATTLIGHTADLAIFAGESVEAIEA